MGWFRVGCGRHVGHLARTYPDFTLFPVICFCLFVVCCLLFVVFVIQLHSLFYQTVFPSLYENFVTIASFHERFLKINQLLSVLGSGYVFLLLYRVTKEDEYLYRAQKFSEFMQTKGFQTGSRTPDSPYSLYEGLAGTVCFYADLLNPSSASFPFFEVF